MKRNKINFQLSDMKLDELWLKTRRGVLYALYLIGALLVQNVILSHVALFGVRAMFLPALVVAAALFEGGWGGGLFGLAAGILSDLFFGSQSVLFTVLFPVMGFIAGFSRRFLSQQAPFHLLHPGRGGALSRRVRADVQSLFYQGQSSCRALGNGASADLWSLPVSLSLVLSLQKFPVALVAGRAYAV